MLAEKRVRALLKPADPARNPAGVPRPVPAHELILLAEGLPDPARTHRARPTRRLLLAAGAVAAVAAAAGGAAVLRNPGDGVGPADVPAGGAAGVLVPMAFSADTDGPRAASSLRELADRLGPAPYDGHSGRYVYHRTKTWGDPVEIAPGGQVMGFATESREWLAADGAAWQRTVELEPEFPDRASRDWWTSHGALDGRRGGGQPDAAPAGGQPGASVAGGQPGASPAGPGAGEPGAGGTPAPTGIRPIPRQDVPPLPADRAGLADLLQTRYGGGAVAKALSTVYERYAVPRRTRADLLRVLADVPGLRWRGAVTDRSGRPGVAVTFVDPPHHQQTVLVFDARTGALLAHELTTTAPLRLSYYNLILDTDRTDRLG